MNSNRKREIKRYCPEHRFSSKVPIIDRYHILEEDIRHYDTELDELIARICNLRTERRHAQAEFYRVSSWLAEYHQIIKQSIKSEGGNASPREGGYEAIAKIDYAKDLDCRPHNCRGGAHEPECCQRFYNAPPAVALPYCLAADQYSTKPGKPCGPINHRPFDSYKSRIPAEGWPIRNEYLYDLVAPEKKEEEAPAKINEQSMPNPNEPVSTKKPGHKDTEDIARMRKCLENLKLTKKGPDYFPSSSDSDNELGPPTLPVIYPPYRKYGGCISPTMSLININPQALEEIEGRKFEEQETTKSSLEPLSSESDGTPEKLRIKDPVNNSQDCDKFPDAANKGSLSSVDEVGQETTQEMESELSEIIVTPDMTDYEDPVLCYKTPDCDKLLEEAIQESLECRCKSGHEKSKEPESESFETLEAPKKIRYQSPVLDYKSPDYEELIEEALQETLKCRCEFGHEKSKEPESEPFEILEAPKKIRYQSPVLLYKSPDYDELIDEALQETLKCRCKAEHKLPKESEFEPYKTFDALKTVRYHEPILPKIPNCDEELQKAYGSPTRIFCEVKPGKSQSETTDTPKKVQREDSVQVKEIPDCLESFQNSMRRVSIEAQPKKSKASASETCAKVDAPEKVELEDVVQTNKSQDCVELMTEAYKEYLKNATQKSEEAKSTHENGKDDSNES